MEAYETAIKLLPEKLRKAALDAAADKAEEIRLRLGHRPTVLESKGERSFSDAAITREDLLCVLERATGASLHCASAQLLQGYISSHGIRIGVCGSAVIHGDELTGLKDFSSLAIRIPREIRGVCDGVLAQIRSAGFGSTLIISPPGGGKTTALREIIRSLSDSGRRVSVLDERCELSAGGESGLDFSLGSHSDILTGVDKEKGTIMLLRGMNPQIIAMDEISKPEDVNTLSTISGCGVYILVSAHARDFADLLNRPIYRKMLEMQIFKYLIEIRGLGEARTYTVRRLEQ